MNQLTCIIPSRNMDNLRVSVPAVRKLEPNAHIIIVDDGVVWKDVPPEFNGVEVLGGDSPFVFSRNVNIGIRAAEENDVVLLNDDAILQTPGGFSIMQAAAEADPQVGIIGAVTDLTGQPEQRRQRDERMEDISRHLPSFGLRAVEHIAFVAVLLPKRTRDYLNQWHEGHCRTRHYGEAACDCVARNANGGLLDEDFCIDYGVEDRSYCYWVRRTALCVCVHDAAFVNHSSLHSSFRGNPEAPGSFQENLKLFKKKWGLSVV